MNELKIRREALGLLIGFGAQFLIGMLLNLFVSIPSSHPGSTGLEYFSRSSHSLVWSLSGNGGWQLAFHSYISLALLGGTISLFIGSLAIHNKKWIIVSGVTAIFTLMALFNGLSYVNYNKNASSMIMAVCWFVAVSALSFGLIKILPYSPTQKHN